MAWKWSMSVPSRSNRIALVFFSVIVIINVLVLNV